MIARWQLLELGVHPQAIKHRLASGRLHAIYRGVYAVGRPELTQMGRWMSAVLVWRRFLRIVKRAGLPLPATRRLISQA